MSDVEYFETNLELIENQNVICDTENGLMFGIFQKVGAEHGEREYKKVVRIETERDAQKLGEIE